MQIAEWMFQSTQTVPDQGMIEGFVNEEGKISAGIDEGLDRNQVLFFAPYGIASFPPKGEDLLLLQDAGKLSCMGVRSTQNGLEEGELELFSSGGASILLQNDGSVVINGAITITDEGEVIKTSANT